jgi:ribose-phosphate pyrophosphokinase
MELLLLITAARRAGAAKVTAVIPYFAFKYHKRGAAISTKHHSRFLWSAVSDFAKLLEAAGVDMVISHL